MDELFGPRMNGYREVCFYFTRYGFRKHKKLIRYLLRVSDLPVVYFKTWKPSIAVYQDKEQVALFRTPPVLPPVRKRMLQKAIDLYRGGY